MSISAYNQNGLQPQAAPPAGADAPPTPYAPRPQRRQQRPQNPYGPQQPQGQPPSQGGAPQGPNPMHVNQSGMAPQGYQPPNPAYAAQLGQASPNPMRLQVADQSGNTPQPVPPAGAGPNPGLVAAPPIVGQPPIVDRNYVAPWGSSAPSSPGVSDHGATPAYDGSLEFKQWKNALNRADQAGAYTDPYRQAATSRLNGLDGNYDPGAGPAWSDLDGPQGGQLDTQELGDSTQALANNAFDRTTDLTQDTYGAGRDLSGIFGSGQVGAQQAGGNALGRLGYSMNGRDANALQALSRRDNLTDETYGSGRDLFGLMGSGQVGAAQGDATNNQRLADYSTAQDTALNGLQGGPNYDQLAQNTFAANNKLSDIGLNRQLDEYRQQQAADGRLGLSADKGVQDILTQAQASRDAQSAQLALSAASGTTAQQQARLQGAQGLVGQQAGMQQNTRDYQTQLGVGNADRQARNVSSAYGLGSNIAGDTARNRLDILGASSQLQGQDQSQANYEQNYATQLGVGNAQRRASNAASAYGMGGDIAKSDASNRLGMVGAAAGLQGQGFGQGMQGYQQRAAERGAGLSFQQQQYANQLGLNAQQYAQMMGLANYGDPTKLQQPYDLLAGVEGGLTSATLSSR